MTTTNDADNDPRARDVSDGSDRRPDNRLALGGALIILGAIALGLQLTDVDLTDWLGGSGWTLFVIVPGIALLVAGLIFTEAGLGLSIAGSIITIVGLLLLYQDANDHYESWAYAWALVAPGGVGLGMLIHGLRTGKRDVLTTGGQTLLTGVVIFVVGAIFFESIFDRGRLPFDIGQSWPIAVVVIGAVLVVLSLIRRGGTGSRSPG
jgi:hypothetical protein